MSTLVGKLRRIMTLLREFPAFELAVDEDEIVYRPNFNLRGPKYLPVVGSRR